MARSTTIFVVLTALLQICLLVSASPTSGKSYPELDLFARQATNDNCGAGSKRCTNPSVSNFCCPTGTDCIPVLGNKAVGCCPTGQDCRVIGTSECSSIEGAVSSPSLLTRCSSGKCCPPGYLCDGNHCQLEYSSWPTSVGEKQPISTSLPSEGGGNSTSLSEAQKLAGFISKDDCPVITAGGFASGFAPGLVIGAALASLIFFVRNRKRERMARSRSWSRMPSDRTGSRKGNRSATNEKVNSKVSSKQSVTIGYQPEVVVTAPSETYDGLGVSIGGRHYAASNTSTQMFAQYDDPSDQETSRRGHHRAHGETPPLPSLTIHGADSAAMGHSSEFLNPSGSNTVTPTKKHKRKNSNPSFKDLANASRLKFRNLLSHENLKEQRGSLGSETSVGSSIHSSVFTGSERQSRGNRYPIAVQTNGKAKGPSQVTPTSLRQEVTLERANTTATDTTNIDDQYTPITPSNPRAFTNSDVPNPPPAPSSHIALPVIQVPPHEHTLRPQLTSPELREQYLNIPQPAPLKIGDRASVATEMTEVEGYRSPFHDRFQYGTYIEEGISPSDYSDDDRRSIAANSTYPSSFLDIHFDSNISPISPIDSNTYGNRALREAPSLPVIPPLFQHKNKPLETLAHSNPNLKSSGSRKSNKRAGSPIDRESVDITVLIDDPTHGVAPNWRNNNHVDSTGSNRTIGIGGAMTGGRYTLQTMEINKF
ncbi:hypothetical protein TWF569_009193 [Orbilia oligospora]|uniref:Uncharacterized protein n=1 Tax=Orbilia oligospora TaxID=2813651 RepID=A0A7C8J0C6_ORBOL|nr:hypothetical protein TWF706_001080 [Orbilia oligospora]KAF3085695.1 hypothetical protein TWF102_011322 [Orbilia oligospora]KAF3100813.1 hypothetical protein TWF103_008122 [Orbilia oligospora]KAF3127892.1 hypothetical protein TWF594_000553 [Orbilia oligospora]KAF3137493.1 hypothetical protein TWF569_009193 [Orbilia oligospora]